MITIIPVFSPFILAAPILSEDRSFESLAYARTVHITQKQCLVYFWVPCVSKC